MRLELTENAVSLYLGREEVEKFRAVGWLECQTDFGPDLNYALVFSLEISPLAQSLSATFLENRVRVQVPPSLADEWAYSDRLELRSRQSLSNGSKLLIRVLKESEEALLRPPQLSYAAHQVGLC